MQQTLLGKDGRCSAIFIVDAEADAYAVEDRLRGLTFMVQKVRGRFVGPCTCDEESELSGSHCSHQSAVRRFLMDRWCYGKDSKQPIYKSL